MEISVGPPGLVPGGMHQMNGNRVICWFSCGAASAVAAKKTIEAHGKNVIVVNCDTRKSEHPDNYRFSKECESWFGKQIIHIRSDKYETVEEVFRCTRYMSGVRGARCTTELKKLPRLAFAKPDDVHVFGFTSDESRRIHDCERRNPELRLLWTLRDLRISKAQCYHILTEAGIKLPIMYSLGFGNNNCPGCVKASSPWYWSMVRRHFPDVFQQRAELSRELGVRLVEIHHHDRIFLDELPRREFKKPRRKENMSCGPECGLQGKLNL